MSSDHLSDTLNIPCPGCGHESKQEVRRLQAEPAFHCGNRGHLVHVDLDYFAPLDAKLSEQGAQIRKLFGKARQLLDQHLDSGGIHGAEHAVFERSGR